MRVQQALASNDRNLALQLQEFADYLLRVVGQGTIPTVTLPPFNTPSDFIPIPEAMHLQGNNLMDLIQAIYGGIARDNTAEQRSKNHRSEA